MALINKEHNFIFFHLFRCGGNSMREILNGNNSYELHGVHSLPIDAKEQFYIEGKSNDYDKYYKFTFVRNPFDWLLSTYLYINKFDENIKGMTLRQFIEYYINYMMLNEGKGLGANKCTTLLDYVSDKDGNIIVDFIGKFENMQQDMDFVSDRIGIKKQKLQLINAGVQHSDYKQCYDISTKKLVEEHFSRDLNHFNYIF